MPRPSAAEVIARLQLEPHPEGGHFREIYRRAAVPGVRSGMTSIYYLLAAGERSAWHRLKTADELWYFHAGDALALQLSTDGQGCVEHRLGPEPERGDAPQVVVPAGVWQSAHPLGRWALVGCAVSPGFEFSDFEMAPADFAPAPA